MTSVRPALAHPGRLAPWLLLWSALATGCGGGGGGGGSTTTTSSGSTQTTAQVSGTVVDGSSSTPVSNATVTVETRSGAASSTTGSSGSYAVTVTTADLPTASSSTPVVVTIDAPGYQPVVQTFTTPLVAGQTYPIGTGAVPTLALTRLVDGELAVGSGARLVHLGDGIYPTSSANSQFQARASGLSRSVRLGSITGLDLSGYTQLTITIGFKGLEASGCSDRLTFFQSTASDGATARSNVQVLRLADSPSSGTFDDQVFRPALSGLDAALGDLWVELTSGSCGAIDAADDYEFVNIRAKFLP